jgi:hypothetical protein
MSRLQVDARILPATQEVELASGELSNHTPRSKGEAIIGSSCGFEGPIATLAAVGVVQPTALPRTIRVEIPGVGIYRQGTGLLEPSASIAWLKRQRRRNFNGTQWAAHC